MPARQRPSVVVKFAVAAVFLGGLGFGAVAALSEPGPRAKTRPTPVVVAKAEPTQPDPTPTPEPKLEPKPEPKKPEPKKPEPKKPEPTRPAPEVKKPDAKPAPAPTPTPEPKKPDPAKAAVTFQKVQGIFKAACVSCHGSPNIRGMFDIRTPASIMMKKGMVVPGKPDESEVWIRVDGDLMPPPEAKITLTPAEKKLIKDWIAGGAK